ncbi:hypothetical protein [Croceitalea vernalis]|uniref:Polysaccharide chain length determinant N-terminal domain-containing protein n=1 Tax=Croceitalea vernalis TaxID=3075599 RepID=A0ABU3BEC1_9FLAO|nr:hypothetical protein [Croceitalea sp. P007]MDT0620499.1 hypothetical protein [Croceitalea sp. P007]
MANQPSNTNNDEIDLGQLFHLIGKGIDNFFNFIANIFKQFFHLIVLFLLFLQKNFIVLIVTLILGTVVGYFMDKLKTEKFVSRMVVEPNFNSVQQLYNNIDFYNDLAKSKDSIALSQSLEVTVGQASTIKKVFVDSYSDENQKVKLFDNFIRELDTTTVKALDFQSYLENFNSMDARFHQISVISSNNTVAKIIQPAIIESISDNDYFKLQKRINDNNLKLQDSIIMNQLVEVDSLQKLYKTVLVKEADKPMQGTNINLAENGESQNKELALIQERNVLKNQLVKLNEERANKSAILNVISDFPARGVKQDGFWNNYLFVIPLAMLSLIFCFLGIKDLNKFLKNYSK